MFKLPDPNKPTEVLWPVVVDVPADKASPSRQTFHVRFRVPDQDELTELLAGDLEALALEGKADNVRAVLTAVITGWHKDVGDHEGAPLPFTDEALGRLLGIPYVRQPLLNAFLDCVKGRRAKN